uniref:Uncharacterized protein n=1 Tax=Acrobeloides nanus TaxID=290746 RepID=A0A914D6X2_9BILA
MNLASTSSATPSTSNWSVIGQVGQPFLQPFHLRPAYRFKSNVIKPEDLMQDGPGRRLRKNVANVRKHVDHISNVLNHIDARLWQHSRRDRLMIQADILYQSTILPPSSTMDTPVDCVCTKFVRAAMNKVKCPVYSVCVSFFIKMFKILM